MEDHPQSLDGLRIVEYGTVLGGAYATKLLSDAGAETIKIESPQGDPLRSSVFSYAENEEQDQQGIFNFLNTNKLGVTLDPTKAAGHEVLEKLLQDADVFLWSGVARMSRTMRFHYRNLKKINPRLVVVSVTPFGLTGPYRNWKGGEFITYNLGGMGYATPGMPDEVDDPPNEPPLHPRVRIADFITGQVAAVATMMGIFAREQDGLGRHVDVSSMEAVVSMLHRDTVQYSYAHIVTGRLPVGVALMPNTIMPCKDGWVVLATPYHRQWDRLVEAMDNPDWAELEVFADGYQRSIHWDSLRPLMEQWTMEYTRQEIMQKTQLVGVPCFAAFSVKEMIESKQMQERAYFWDIPTEKGPIKVPGAPFKLSETPLRLRRSAPQLGQHTSEVLGRHGLSISELQILRDKDVV